MKTISLDRDIEIIIQHALNEDLQPGGDITTENLNFSIKDSKFNLVVNENSILSGLEVFKKTFLLVDNNVSFESTFKDGDKLKSGDSVVILYGNTRSILKAERTALNFICHLSGIATTTSKLVKLVNDKDVVLLDTRKTTPGLRYIEKQAVLAGGGKNHRMNLSDMILIKDNHIKAVGNITSAVNSVRGIYGEKIKIEVEVKNLKELKEAISSNVNIIMFDNWGVNDLKSGVKLVPENILTEASGGINLENIREYSTTGVDCISTSYMIKNNKWVDFSLEAVGL